MKNLLLLLGSMVIYCCCHAQYVYTINADSVKITSSCDSAELIIQNHTQGVNGFLFNTGNGRTVFQRGLLQINDSVYLIGSDTLKIGTSAFAAQSANTWLGNATNTSANPSFSPNITLNNAAIISGRNIQNTAYDNLITLSNKNKETFLGNVTFDSTGAINAPGYINASSYLSTSVGSQLGVSLAMANSGAAIMIQKGQYTGYDTVVTLTKTNIRKYGLMAEDSAGNVTLADSLKTPHLVLSGSIALTGTSGDSVLMKNQLTGMVYGVPFSSNYIINGTSPQTAHYYVTNANTNSTTGEELGTEFENFTWSATSPTPPSSGALYASQFNNETQNNLNFNGNNNIANSVTFATSFNRLTLNSTISGRMELDGNEIGSTTDTVPRAMSAEATQVDFPNLATGISDTVSDVASINIKSAYQEPGLADNPVNIVNYYQLLIEPSINNMTKTAALLNTYGIYQSGPADTNVLKGPISYRNKYSTSATPSCLTSTGAGTSATASLLGTTDGGVLTITTGSSTAVNAIIATITFSNFSFPTGCSVVLFPGNRNAAGLTGAQAVYTAGSSAYWTFTSGTTALAASTTYVWNYQISGY